MATQRIGWDLSTGHLFSVATAEGGRGHLILSAAHMTANLQSYLRMADLLNHFTIHTFRGGSSLRKSLAGTAVDEIMKYIGWEAESVAKYYIRATSSGQVWGSKRKRGQSFADSSELPLSPEFRMDFAACAGKDRVDVIEVWETLFCPEQAVNYKGNLEGGIAKYGRDHRQAQEASSDPIYQLNDPR